jgi:hypothetical protein
MPAVHGYSQQMNIMKKPLQITGARRHVERDYTMGLEKAVKVLA